MTMVASPLAASGPASVAIGWPKRREPEHLGPGISLPESKDDLLGAVGARIHAEDQLPIHVEAVEHTRHPSVYALDVRFLAMDRNDQVSVCIPSAAGLGRAFRSCPSGSGTGQA
jgi:hypothetical protein